jgi:hypothetical protein
MTPPSFDNIINKFKSSTKHAVDQASRAARVTKLKMDIMTQNGEKTRLLQNVGEKTYQLFSETKGLDGLLERIRNEFTMIQRIEERIREIEDEIHELQTMPSSPDITDATEVKEVTEPADSTAAEGKPQDDQQA